MPAAAIPIAAVAIGGAVASTTVFTVAAAVGATIAAVGSITKSKPLMIAGTVLGAAGGIGALADSAGLFGSSVAESATGTGMGAAGEMGSQVAATQAAAAGMPGSIAPDAAAGTGIMNAATTPTTLPVASEPVNNVIDTISNSVVPGSADVTPTANPSTGGASTLTNDNIPMGDASGGVGVPGGSPATQMGMDTPGPLQAQAAPTPVPVNGPGPQQTAAIDTTGIPAAAGSKPTYLESLMGTPQGVADQSGGSKAWGKIMDFVDKHPAMALGAISAAGSFISGATSPLTPAQVSALNSRAALDQAQTRLADAQTARLSRQLSNTSQPLPVAKLGRIA